MFASQDEIPDSLIMSMTTESSRFGRLPRTSQASFSNIATLSQPATNFQQQQQQQQSLAQVMSNTVTETTTSVPAVADIYPVKSPGPAVETDNCVVQSMTRTGPMVAVNIPTGPITEQIIVDGNVVNMSSSQQGSAIQENLINGPINTTQAQTANFSTPEIPFKRISFSNITPVSQPLYNYSDSVSGAPSQLSWLHVLNFHIPYEITVLLIILAVFCALLESHTILSWLILGE